MMPTEQEIEDWYDSFAYDEPSPDDPVIKARCQSLWFLCSYYYNGGVFCMLSRREFNRLNILIDCLRTLGCEGSAQALSAIEQASRGIGKGREEVWAELPEEQQERLEEAWREQVLNEDWATPAWHACHPAGVREDKEE